MKERSGTRVAGAATGVRAWLRQTKELVAAESGQSSGCWEGRATMGPNTPCSLLLGCCCHILCGSFCKYDGCAWVPAGRLTPRAGQLTRRVAWLTLSAGWYTAACWYTGGPGSVSDVLPNPPITLTLEQQQEAKTDSFSGLSLLESFPVVHDAAGGHIGV